MDTDAVLALLRDVAAEVITPRFRALAASEIAEKNPGDLVTVADRESEELITAALLAAYPDAVVLGEEAVATNPSLLDRFEDAEHGFTVDPVDGTKNFVHGSPDHAVMVAEVRRGEVVRAWIHQPQHEVSYVAERGAGAWRNGEPLRVAADTDAPYRTARRQWVGRELPGLGTLELTWACCGVDYPQLIAGAARALVYNRSMPWDHLPGGLILTEAGGVLGDHDGQPLGAGKLGGGIVAAPDRATYDAVVAALAAD
ncbi:inositol monophosphatase [Nocardioides sp. zg-536]|uniref:Inositol monophosphatase n=1 Tax=Nocardioides faecalis TaxID=2803858 RepID=A0A938Y6X0_9ACTN|nr:inositol monophosphatase [Nocardioides faecalis]MBM9459338.1 inositol monophosphatase [Nocardioides faecalis]QVI59545.1 inositol monophosphatase [Nocardioides faecalis]